MIRVQGVWQAQVACSIVVNRALQSVVAAQVHRVASGAGGAPQGRPRR